MSSAAELALKKKYALLKKRQEAASGGGANTAGSAPAAPAAAANQDPARMAAIRALQAKRAAAGERQAAAPAAQPAAAPAAAPTKLKLVIPKRERSSAPAELAKPAAPVDPARAAALAALKARAASGAAATGQQQAQQAAAPKRPSMPKRPSARPRPTPQQALQAAAGSAAAAAPAALDGTFGPQHAAEQQQQLDQFGGGAGGYPGAEDDGRAAKRQRTEQGGEDEPNTTLFCGDLPPYWASADLLNFFSEYGEVLEARVIGSQCYGFVRFARLADAEGVLEFAQQQGMWADERMLRINWAQGSMPDWKKGPAVHRALEPGEGPGEAYEHPRVKEARLQAQQVAASVEPQQIAALTMQRAPERQLVSYEDL